MHFKPLLKGMEHSEVIKRAGQNLPAGRIEQAAEDGQIRTEASIRGSIKRLNQTGSNRDKNDGTL
jgi:hypothetical protein